jgi:hypothetical protein
MIRKMREDKEKKNMPMANAEEAAYEAPGLRVGKDAWKWPPVWPYDGATFTPTQDLVDAGGGPDLASMAGVVNGMPASPTQTEVGDEDKLNPLKYWEEKADVSTELDPQAADNLRK